MTNHRQRQTAHSSSGDREITQARSPAMNRVASCFGQYDVNRSPDDPAVPPELTQLGVSTRWQVIELFQAAVGDGRSEKTFRGSLEGDIRYIAGSGKRGRS